ncbi:MAG: glycosyltransferase [Actinomycetota bacterium]
MARILFTFAGGSGHADPLVPIAEAASAAGHKVAFAGGRSGAIVAEEQGFSVFLASDGAGGAPSTIAPLRPLDMEREYAVLRDFYAGVEASRRADQILELSELWRPDLVVCDEVDFGSMVAAERLGLPHATVLVTAAGSFVRPDVVAEPLRKLRDQLGLTPGPERAVPHGSLVVSPFPPSFRDPAYPLPPNSISIRSEPVGVRVPDPARAWGSANSDRATVHLTLGTVFNTESGDLFERAISGLRELPVEVVVTVGRDLDPEMFGPQPANVHIERFIPQSSLLPNCDLVVNHGGSGSVIGALAHGLPMVVLPMGAGQALNADRCEQLGVGITLDAARAGPQIITTAVTEMLDDADFRFAAEAVRREIAALPGPATVVPLLEQHIVDGG